MLNIWPSTSSKPNQENMELELFVWGVAWYHNLTKDQVGTQGCRLSHLQILQAIIYLYLPTKKKPKTNTYQYLQKIQVYLYILYIFNPHYGPLHIGPLQQILRSVAIEMVQKKRPKSPKKSTSRDAMAFRRCGASWESKGGSPNATCLPSPKKNNALTALAKYKGQWWLILVP